MAFISTAFASRYPPTKNQLKTSSNPRNQAAIQDDRRLTEIWELLHQINQRSFDVTTEKMLLVQALEARVILDEEELAFLVDTRDRADSGLYTQTLPTTVIFHTDDLDAFDSDCNEALSASAVLMAKLFAYDSDVLSDIPN
ncbi:hypothetical protein Tco_0709121 [Tanacetum coccineum]